MAKATTNTNEEVTMAQAISSLAEAIKDLREDFAIERRKLSDTIARQEDQEKKLIASIDPEKLRKQFEVKKRDHSRQITKIVGEAAESLLRGSNVYIVKLLTDKKQPEPQMTRLVGTDETDEAKAMLDLKLKYAVHFGINSLAGCDAGNRFRIEKADAIPPLDDEAAWRPFGHQRDQLVRYEEVKREEREDRNEAIAT